MTQCERVLKYMRDFGSINPAQAMQDLGVMRLGARIYDQKRGLQNKPPDGGRPEPIQRESSICGVFSGGQ